jgi:hypothetical protein
MRTRLSAAVVLLVPVLAGAQARWKAIGTTNAGNTVYVDPHSVKKSGALVSADVRVVFTPAVQTPRGTMGSTRTSGTFDCAKRALAVKETVTYGDARGAKVIDRRVNKIPGYGSVLGNSPSDLALRYLCAR